MAQSADGGELAGIAFGGGGEGWAPGERPDFDCRALAIVNPKEDHRNIIMNNQARRRPWPCRDAGAKRWEQQQGQHMKMAAAAAILFQMTTRVRQD